MGHKHAPTAISNQSQSIQCISAIHHYANIKTNLFHEVDNKIPLRNQVFQNIHDGTLYPSKDAVEEEKYYMIN